MQRQVFVLAAVLFCGLLVASYMMFANYYMELEENTTKSQPCPINNTTIIQNFYSNNHTLEIIREHTVEYLANNSVSVEYKAAKKPERSPSAVGIAILLPTTSRVVGKYCEHCLNIISVGMRELVQTIPINDTRYWYTVYVGYDDGDPMWDHEGRLKANLDVANQLFWRHPVEVKGVRVMRYPDPNKGSLTNVWNKLCEEALADGNEYVFLDNDDLIIETYDFAAKLVDTLKKNPVYPGLGEASPYDITFTDTAHPTFPLVSRVHFEIFGQMYSTEIFSRGCDTWLGDVYRGFGSVFTVQGVQVANTAYGTPRRYDNDFNDGRYRELVVQGRKTINNFLQQKGVQGTWPVDLCGVTSTFGC